MLKMTNCGHGNPQKLLSAKIEATMLRSLQSETWINNSGETRQLVPVYWNSWVCQGDDTLFLLALERWDGDMASRGAAQWDRDGRHLAQGKQGGVNVLYSTDQIDDMFVIAKRLDELGVVHGQMAPQHFLWRQKRDTADIDLVVTDFSQATSFGWSSQLFQCPAQDTDDGQVPPQLRGYFNQWQLASALAKYANTWVLVAKGKLARFAGLNSLPAVWKIDLEAQCPAFAEEPSGGGGDLYRIAAVQGLGASLAEPPLAKVSWKALAGREDELDQSRITEEEFNQAMEAYLSQ
jgi:hypothetical protein